MSSGKKNIFYILDLNVPGEQDLARIRFGITENLEARFINNKFSYFKTFEKIHIFNEKPKEEIYKQIENRFKDFIKNNKIENYIVSERRRKDNPLGNKVFKKIKSEIAVKFQKELLDRTTSFKFHGPDAAKFMEKLLMRLRYEVIGETGTVNFTEGVSLPRDQEGYIFSLVETYPDLFTETNFYNFIKLLKFNSSHISSDIQDGVKEILNAKSKIEDLIKVAVNNLKPKDKEEIEIEFTEVNDKDIMQKQDFYSEFLSQPGRQRIINQLNEKKIDAFSILKKKKDSSRTALMRTVRANLVEDKITNQELIEFVFSNKYKTHFVNGSKAGKSKLRCSNGVSRSRKLFTENIAQMLKAEPVVTQPTVVQAQTVTTTPVKTISMADRLIKLLEAGAINGEQAITLLEKTA